MPKVVLGKNGQMVMTDAKGQSTPIDPTELHGYYGDFKCETTRLDQTECEVKTMGMTPDGQFTYEFSPNDDLTSKAGKQNYTDVLTSEIRKKELLRRIDSGDRRL